MDLYILQTFIVPIIALIIPGLIILRKKYKENLTFVLNRKTVVKLTVFWAFLSFTVFTILIYLSGGLNNFYYLEAGGPKIFERSLEWNFTSNIRLNIPIYNAMNLFTVSVLSGLMYATLIVLPPICVVGNQIQKVSTSTLSSITSGASAIASSVVCCSTSLVAVIAPAFSLVIGPFIPSLLVASIAILLYSFYKVVLPRLPLLPKFDSPL